MKLRHQVFFLLVLPLSCQLVTTGTMVLSIKRVDQAVREESAAKEVLATCQEMDALLGQMAILVATPRFLRGSSKANQFDYISKPIREKLMLVCFLTRSNSKASAISADLLTNIEQLLENVSDLAGSLNLEHRTMLYSRYFEGADFFESTKVQFDKVLQDLNQLRGIYRPVVQELSPASLSARRDMGNALIAAMAANIVLVAALAIVINRNTLSRLQMLLSNMKSFAKGQQEYKRLSGADELAELDDAFAQMASERDRLEQIRKSMRAMVSHDLRSPLTSMSLGLEMVLDGDLGEVPGNIAGRLKVIHSESRRLKRLSDTLLDIERMEDDSLDVDLRSTPCRQIVAIAVDAVRAQLASTQITVVEPDTSLWCLSDQDRTIQVLVNFLSNAIKFSPAKTQIEIVVRAIENGMVRFDVIDQGRGVPEDKVDSLFGKFTQLDQPSEIKKQGSGLGLYICKMLIGAQKGLLGYERNPAGGSCFWFALPECQPTASFDSEDYLASG